jgi:hypothetical protein
LEASLVDARYARMSGEPGISNLEGYGTQTFSSALSPSSSRDGWKEKVNIQAKEW